MSTPHNEAKKGDIADIVLMPGDPMRAKMIAERYLEDVKLVNQVRGAFGYTGTYKGKRISVFTSGMGMPSIGIYTYELFSQYDVKAIIRIGSAGSYVPELALGDVVLAEYAWSESTFGQVQNGSTEQIKYPGEVINELIKETARKMDEKLAVMPIHSTDVFYQEGPSDYYKKIYEEHGCGCVEMESFALFHNAGVFNRDAACMLTISDSFVSDEKMSPESRQNSFHKMISIALEAAVCYGGQQENG